MEVMVDLENLCLVLREEKKLFPGIYHLVEMSEYRNPKFSSTRIEFQVL